MSAATPVPLRFMIGARTLFALRPRLLRVPLTLVDARAGGAPSLPALPPDAQGYWLTSLPEAQLDAVRRSGMIGFVRQRYVRSFVDLSIGFDAWFAGLSANTRQGLKRKAKRLAAESGGRLDVHRFRTPDELAVFHPAARALSARTYQERLLGAGLPEDLAGLQRLAAADAVRAWLLTLGDRPIAYLCCRADGDTLLYAHVGHDPEASHLSPGAVLQLEALRDLFGDRFAWFDFTEGEGQHKRQMASGGVACVDLLLLRPTLANRATLTTLRGFDGGVARMKWLVRRLGVERIARRLRRG
ncbi:GNAT family N-acetyltransferase [Sphingomonas elodea]|uniref:GNAT family N-acetyltransferase n=1 Tax=Sphingomonas elodea TaxID=179878 RepID=UPI00026302E6|nr:GNAT family N-acetyltransferase [Sphingomonas elodea]